jgi:cell wall-associated NlpC family hydrolase
MNFKGKKEVVKAVQKILGVSTDGADGPVTWNAILAKLSTKETSAPNGTIPEKMVSLAREEIGVSEVDGSNCGPRVDEYKAATWLDADKGWPWCAAFICWLVREAIEGEDVSFKRPRTAGAWDFENWAKQESNRGIELRKPTNEDIKAGDIVVFTFSHIGIAVKDVDSSGYVVTIEGNTNGAGSREGGSVLEKKRHVSKIRSRIRIL